MCQYVWCEKVQSRDPVTDGTIGNADSAGNVHRCKVQGVALQELQNRVVNIVKRSTLLGRTYGETNDLEILAG